MSDQLNKKLPDKQALDDFDLKNVIGGGLYYPVADCPSGISKLVSWFGVGVLFEHCPPTCAFLKESGGMESGQYCEKATSSTLLWE